MSSPTGSLQALLASNGAFLLTGTSASTVEHYGVVIREDTVISAWTASSGAQEINLLTYFNISGTLTVNDIALIIPEGWDSVSITLTSGTVWLLRK